MNTSGKEDLTHEVAVTTTLKANGTSKSAHMNCKPVEYLSPKVFCISAEEDKSERDSLGVAPTTDQL